MSRIPLTLVLATTLCITSSSVAGAQTVIAQSDSIHAQIIKAITNPPPSTTYEPALGSFVPNNQLAGTSTLIGCDAYENAAQISSPTPCVEGNVSSTNVVVLVGDSNVGNWAPGLSSGLAKSNYQLDVFMFAGCPTSDIQYVEKDFIGTSPSSCNSWHQNVLTAIAKLSPIAVMTASSGIGPQYNQSVWDNGYKSLFAAASANRSTVRRIVIGTSPYFTTAPPLCLSVNTKTPLRCVLSTRANTIVGPYSSYASRDASVAKISDATLINTSSLFCYESKCPAEVGGTITFADNDHVTTDYSEKISVALTTAVLKVLQS